MPVALHILSKR